MKNKNNSQLTSRAGDSQSRHSRAVSKNQSSSVISNISNNKKRGYHEISNKENSNDEGSNKIQSSQISASLGYGSKRSNGQKLSQSVQNVRQGNKRLKVEAEVSKTSGQSKENQRGREKSVGGNKEEQKQPKNDPSDLRKSNRSKNAAKQEETIKKIEKGGKGSGSKAVVPIRGNYQRNQRGAPKDQLSRSKSKGKYPNFTTSKRPQRSSVSRSASASKDQTEGKNSENKDNKSVPGKKVKSTHDSVYSNSFKYKSTANNRADRYDKKEGERRSSRTPDRRSSRSPEVANTAKPQSKSRTERARNTKISTEWDIDDDSIRDVMDMYLSYIIHEKCTRLKLKSIKLGKFFNKKVSEQDRYVQTNLTNICFELCNNTNRDFSECDLIEFNTGLRQKELPSLYLIREIILTLDYSGKVCKTEKQDDTLPDIDIQFKVHPVFQAKNFQLFPEAQKAQTYIEEFVDDEYVLDHKGSLCLFEIGGRKIEDLRLEFERFVYNLSNIQKSQLFTKESPNSDIQTDIKQVKSKNQLKTNYDKCYIVFYGYKYEDPNQIYVLNQDKIQQGGFKLTQCIKQWTKSMKTNKSGSSYIQESIASRGAADVESQSLRSQNRSQKQRDEGDDHALIRDDVHEASKSTGKLKASQEKDKSMKSEISQRRGSRRERKITPVSVKKKDLIENDDQTVSEEDDEQPSQTKKFSQSYQGDSQKIKPSSTHKIEPSQTVKVDPFVAQEEKQILSQKSRSQRSLRSKKDAAQAEVESSNSSIKPTRGRRQKRHMSESDEASEANEAAKSEKSEEEVQSRSRSKRGRSGRPETRATIRKSQIIQEESEDQEESDHSYAKSRSRTRGRQDAYKNTQKTQEEDRVEYPTSDDDDQSVLGQKNTKSANYANEYDAACATLQLNFAPDNLPCRDREKEIIYNYVMEGVTNQGSSSSLYISGMPGTGKTATTLEVVKNILKEKKEEKKKRRSDSSFNSKMKNVEYIHINAMNLTNPNLVYTILCEKIIGRRMNPQSAAQFLDEFFKKKDKKSIALKYMSKRNGKQNLQEAQRVADRIRVVLIDELDALITPKQTLLYNLFDWPCHSSSKLLLISIANTMDLPERLQSKITSRIGNNRLVYEPYTSKQIQFILESRLDGLSIFQQKSLEIVSKKVAQYSGDIRRSLQIAKRAVEMCREHYLDQGSSKSSKLLMVDLRHIASAYDEMANSNTVKVLRGLRKFEIMVMIALFLELKTQNTDKVLIDSIQDRCEIILNAMKTKPSELGKATQDRGQDDIEMQDEDDMPIKKTKFYLNWEKAYLTTTMFREIVKRLQSFGLINLIVESSKITDNSHVQLLIYFDELKNAFECDEIYKQQEKIIELHGNRD